MEEEYFANYEKSGSCLICNDDFEEKPLPTSLLSAERDRQIVASDNDRTVNNEELLVDRWKTAFQLFSRLLNSTTEEAGAGYVWDTNRFHLVLEKLFEKTRTQGIFQSPCCSICSSVLFEIVKLQEAIDENLKLQEERVKQLKQKLAATSVRGQNQDDNLFGESNMDMHMEPEWDNISISDFSVETVVKPKVKVKSPKRKRRCPLGKRQVEVAQATDTIKQVKLEIKPCMVLLERLSDSTSLPIPTNDIVKPAPSTSRERRSKLKAQEIIRKSCGVSMKDEFVEMPVKTTRKSFKKKRKVEESEEEDEWKEPVAGGPENEVGDPTMDLDEDNDNRDDYEIAANSKRQRRKGKQNLNEKRKTILGTHLSRKLVGPRRVARSDLFLLINDNFLFHKSTVIEVYLRHKMICKETNCSFEAEGIDSSAFDKIRKHIINCHMTKKNYSHKIRSCPVCGKQLSGHALKIHLIEHHQVAKVVCEICWKPLQTATPRAHMFRHKNEEERKAAIEDGHDGPRPTSKTGKVRKIPAKIRRRLTNQTSRIRIQPNNKQPKEGLWFRTINDEYLIYKLTLVRFTLNQSFQCAEFDCSFNVSGTSFDSFQEMRRHLATHVESRGYFEKLRECPMCSNSYLGFDFKTHFAQQHHLRLVVICEICWKPLAVKCVPWKHSWTHKNDEEKVLEISLGDKGKPYEYGCKVKSMSKKNTLPVEAGGLLTRIQPNNKQPKDGLWFRTIYDEYLIYKLTLVRFKLYQSLQCGEFDCSFTVSGTNFDSFQEMRSHLATHVESREYFENLRECPLCSNSYLGFDFKTHFAEQHHLRLVVICEICWKPLAVKCMPWMHSWTHKNDEEKALEISLGDQGKPYEYRCKVKSMSRKKTLPDQARLSLPGPRLSGLHPLECEYCGKKLSSRNMLQSHIERIHRPDLIKHPLICDFCGKKFHPQDRWAFEEHMRTVHPQTDDTAVLLPFICDDCGLRFKRRQSLYLHRTAHHTHPEGAVRQHQCEFCEMIFLHKKCLKRHQFCMHSDIVPEGMEDDPRMLKVVRMRERAKDFIGPRRAYACEDCGKVYLSVPCLATHRKKAHGIQ